MTSACDKTISTKICGSDDDDNNNSANSANETCSSTDTTSTYSSNRNVLQDYFMGEQHLASLASFAPPPPHGSNCYDYYRGGQVAARVIHVDGNAVVAESSAAVAQHEGHDDSGIISTAIIVTETTATTSPTGSVPTVSNNVLLRRLSSSISPPPGFESAKPDLEENGMYDCIIRERRVASPASPATIQEQRNDVDNGATHSETNGHAVGTAPIREEQEGTGSNHGNVKDASSGNGGGVDNGNNDDDDDIVTEWMVIFEGSLSDQDLADDVTVETVLAQDEVEDRDFSYPTRYGGAVWIRGQGLVPVRRRRLSRLRELLFGPRNTTRPLAFEDGVLGITPWEATLGQGRPWINSPFRLRRRDRMPATEGSWSALNSEAREVMGTLIEV